MDACFSLVLRTPNILRPSALPPSLQGEGPKGDMSEFWGPRKFPAFPSKIGKESLFQWESSWIPRKIAARNNVPQSSTFFPFDPEKCESVYVCQEERVAICNSFSFPSADMFLLTALPLPFLGRGKVSVNEP